jgi:KaiC/GvpD/RAD55 family RecA-like ATPase
MAYVDEAGEFRLLASVVDRPDTVLGYAPELFTGDRRRIYVAMQQAYLAEGSLSTEGVEQFYGRILPPEIEAARGTRASAALVDKLVQYASKRELSDLITKLSIALANTDAKREDIAKLLVLKPLVSSEDSTLSPGITTFISELGRKLTKQYLFVSTGLPFLDQMLGGEWPRQALSVILGQGGGGKTALVLQTILNMARKGLPCLFVSLEMPRDRIIGRMVANISGIDGMRIRRGDITDEEQPLINRALEEIASLEKYIFIIDRPGLNITEILHQIRFHKDTYNIQAFFVDYLQIIDRPESDNTGEALGYLAQQLRNLAVILDISAVLLSQQNRGFQGLASILGSGRVGHIADVVFEINFDVKSTNDESRVCTLDFHKNRDGAVGAIGCIYYPRVLRFE